MAAFRQIPIMKFHGIAEKTMVKNHGKKNDEKPSSQAVAIVGGEVVYERVFVEGHGPWVSDLVHV